MRFSQRRCAALLAICLGASWGSNLLAADDLPKPIPGVTDKLGLDEKEGGALLGQPFENQVAGITFQPPAGCKQIHKSDKDVIVEFANEEKQWMLKVTRATLAKPMPLQSVNENGLDRVGLLDYTVSDIKKQHPNAEIMRQEIVNVGEYGVGIAVLRLNLGTDRYLRQQAIFQSTEQEYFIFNFTSPAAKNGRPEDDAGERKAAETFKSMLDTIQLTDRSMIKRDQVNRLFRTRALFVDWSDRNGKMLKQAIVPEQWLRIIKNGKDIGYSYVVEEFTEGKDVKSNPARAFDGILISIRTRTVEDNNQVDVGSQYFTSLDRKHEDWANVANIIKDKGLKTEDKLQNSEYGFSEIKLTRVLDKDAPRDEKDRKAPPSRDVETYKISVMHPKREKDTMTKPEYLTPSPWYIPQAIGTMLPRLVPLNKPVTYMFQSYITDSREVVHRYVDVGFEKEVNLAGKTVRAIPVSDRIRLEGAPTVHYMSPDGKYLGSINEEAHLTILPVTKGELEKLWPNPDLTKPETVDPAAATSSGR